MTAQHSGDECESEYEVVIVGAGVAGALCAWKLAELGHGSILLLDAGDNGITHGQRILFHHTMDVQGHRGNPFAPYEGLESRLWAPEPVKSQSGFDEEYYDYSEEAKKKDPFKAGYNRMVGGSTWSWRGNTPRMVPNDFALKTVYGQGRDWPIGYAELEPWYCQAEWELGVSGNHDELDGLHGAYRSRPFPTTGIPPSYSDGRIKARLINAAVRGTPVRVVTTPQARNSAPYDGRPACEGHSNCIPLCPIQAKYDATVHLRRALALGVTLKTAAVVTRIEKGTAGRVSAIVYRDWRSSDPSRERKIGARHVVLAAHAIETPKLLLMSGLANSSDMVGRNLNDHAQFEVIALFPEPVYPFRGPQSITSIEDFRDGAFRREHSAFRMTIGNDGWGRSGSPATVIDQLLAAGHYGKPLPKLIADKIPRMVRISFSTESLPDPANRVALSSKRDKLGVPRPSLTHDIGDYTRAGLRVGFQTAMELFKIMGAEIPTQPKELEPPGKRMNWNTAAHIMSTTIMGVNPADSVVDPWGRTHDHENLWIVGSSVFPTGATANPTLTLAALTLRTTQALHRELALQG